MVRLFSKLRDEFKQPYFCALFIIACVPLFPEYISFFLVVAALFFARKDMKLHKRPLRLGFIGALLLSYCTYLSLTTIISTHPFQSFTVSLMWWFFLLAYLIVVNLLTDTQRTDRFLMCLTATAAIVGLIACVQYRINYFADVNIGNTWLWLDNIVFKLVPFDIFHLNYGLRAYSTFPNPNMLAQYLVLAAPFVACYNFMKQRSKPMRLFSRVCLFLTFAGVAFSFSRGGYIAILILAGALIILNIRRRFAEVFLYVFSTILFLPGEVVNRLFTIKKGISHSSLIADNIIITPHPNMPDHIPMSNAEIIQNSGAESAVGERWEIWLEAIERFFERPFFGYGAGTQPTLIIYEQIGIHAPHAHNIILQLLLEGGIFALLCMVLIGFKVIKNGIMLMRSRNNSAFWMGFGVVAFAVCFVAHGMVDYPLMIPRLVCFFFIALGIAEQTIHLFDTKNKAVCNNLRNRLKKKV